MAVQVEFETRHIESVASHRIGQQIRWADLLHLHEAMYGPVIVIETMANGRPSETLSEGEIWGHGAVQGAYPGTSSRWQWSKVRGARRSMGSLLDVSSIARLSERDEIDLMFATGDRIKLKDHSRRSGPKNAVMGHGWLRCPARYRLIDRAFLFGWSLISNGNVFLIVRFSRAVCRMRAPGVRLKAMTCCIDIESLMRADGFFKPFHEGWARLSSIGV